jgi:type VI secretion system protein ImpL
MNPVLIVAILAAVVLLALVGVWFYLRKKKASASPDGPAPPGSDEIALLVREANAKLAASSAAKGARVATSPVFVVLGEASSAKTSVVLNSGLDPELLAGQVYQSGSVTPTRTANLWFSRGAVFVEAGGPLASDQKMWDRLAAKLSSGAGVFSRGQQAARAAIVCFDCENFTKPGAHQAAVESAKKLRARLGELCRALGIQLPVYVIFTKMDRLPFFTEYVANLTNEEAGQVFGVTLPFSGVRKDGVYAEQQTARLTAELDRLFRSLAALRLEFLPREADAAKLPPVYEFPREFRKARQVAVEFLVDLCRPSELSAGPLLRGVYFSGVRPIVINEAAPLTTASPQSATYTAVADATSLFRPGIMAPAPHQAALQPFARKVPQWLFLGRLFSDVVLADKVAMNASGESTGRSFARRLLFGGAAALCFLAIVAFTVSFFRNRGLESQVRDAARAVPAAAVGGSDIAPVESLRSLETLRQAVAQVAAYRESAPWSYRWGLNVSPALYPEARTVYFDRFRAALFAQTQGELLRFLRGLPPTPGPDYGPTYDALKAYIITTSHPEKSTQPFLPPQLMQWWINRRTIDPERQQLARKQFDFYSAQLLEGNPFSRSGDDAAIAGARRYLAQFAGIERVYAFMLAETSKGIAPVNFNKRFPGSAEAVVQTHEVPGAFTKQGWAAMKDAIAHADRYFSGEPWVLGDQQAANLDLGKLQQELKTRYSTDFIKEWRTYMKSASVLRYAGLKDAAQKLTLLSGNQSPLLELVSLVSDNTAVDDPAVAAIFQPAQAAVPPGSTDRFIAPPNQNYMNALVALQTSIEGIANQPGQPSDAAVAPTLASAGQAKINTRQMAQAFRIDAEGHIEANLQKLLEDPITYAEGLLRTLGPAELNGKGKALCGQFRALMAKFPFNPNGTAEASLAEVNGLFRKPDGALWTFYDQNLQKALVKQGGQYAPAASGSVALTPTFVTFFNTAAGFSEALYPAGAQDPRFTYTLTPEQAEGIQNMTVRLDGDSLVYAGGKGAPKQFTWQGGGAHEAKATLKFGGPDLSWSSNEGLWAVFRFFAKAERTQAAGANETFEWVIRIGKDAVTLPSGKPLTVRLTLDMGAAPRVFDKGYFARMTCVADVARP